MNMKGRAQEGLRSGHHNSFLSAQISVVMGQQ